MTATRRRSKKHRDTALTKARKCKKKEADQCAIELLDITRDFKKDWSTDTRGRPVKAPIKDSHQISAALLHERGEKVSEADSCSRCRRGKGVWQSCVVAPIYKNQALYTHACSNCIHYKRPSECSLRVNFEANGGSAWVDDPEKTKTRGIVRRGGLFAVIKQEELLRIQRERKLQKELGRIQRELERLEELERIKRERERQEALERVQRERERQEALERVQRERERQREREAESEALSRKGRRTKVSVVVQSSPRATKQSSCVKIEDRTLRGPTEPLKERDLLRVGELTVKTEDLLFGLRARKEVLERRLRRQDNLRVKDEDDSSVLSDSPSDSNTSVSSDSSKPSHHSESSETSVMSYMTDTSSTCASSGDEGSDSDA
ncbi:hypothetical protein CNMCM6936_003580 [Aspergillus lentulus]|uniref:Uncharacterized protein n=1 Tax=Aspergillus lentulus TaxID=293939 RepID=A0AAN5YFP4_ASPLE|nr:hypothetical protein CNMCM6936_003580 [Aspergillus lentulus]KAF4171480.1 hypothetical protein CNMCM8060_002889 [Aspergillus lentulus]KAF4186947.1 hypothetical protein CNMCM7927_004682 [Aspergillus lentulus]KAF4196270.1 hypothetical protein CNMCM8694_005364 [Aspergillus lentulus]KAF4200644.1 hypothetical protein CNMCM8927_002774 [Aspergillus lentulus]